MPYPEYLSIEKAWIGMMRPPLCKEIGIKYDYSKDKNENILTRVERFSVSNSLKLNGLKPKHGAVLMAMVEQGSYDCLIDLEGEDVENRVLRYLELIAWKSMTMRKRNEIISTFKKGLLVRNQYDDTLDERIGVAAYTDGQYGSLIAVDPLHMLNYDSRDEYEKIVLSLNI